MTDIVLRDRNCPRCQVENSLRSLLQAEGTKVRWVVFCEKCQWLLQGDSELSVSRIEVDIPSYAKIWRFIEELERRIKTLEGYLKVQIAQTGELKSIPSGKQSTSQGQRKKSVVSDSNR